MLHSQSSNLKALALILGAIAILATVSGGSYLVFKSNSSQADVDSFKEKLETAGFTVQEGKLGIFPLVDLYDAGFVKSCWGNDPNKPYLVSWIPPSPNEKVDVSKFRVAQMFGYGNNLTTQYRLRPDEAIILIGKTPPECKYFSFTGCLMQRTYGNETRTLWAELTNTINNLNIKTQQTTDRSTPAPFNQNTMIVSTADKAVNDQVREAAEASGYTSDIINTYVIPSPILKMGLSDDSDTFNFFLRPSVFANEAAGVDYAKNPPMVVLRVTPKENVTLHPFEMPDLRVQGTGQTELYLTSSLNALKEAILAKYSSYEATELGVNTWLPYGYQSIGRGVNSAGVTRDALYLWTGGALTLPPTPPFVQAESEAAPKGFTLADDEFIIVYGVNHQATGKAAFSSFSVYGADIWNGVGGITSDEFAGTADEYLPNGTNANYFYAYKISRHGNETNCLAIPGSGFGAYGIELNQKIFILYRLYCEPTTQTGPVPEEVLFDGAIKFSPKHSP